MSTPVHCSPAKDAVNPTRRQSIPPLWIGASDLGRLVLAMASAKYLTVLYGKHGNFRTVLLLGGVVAAAIGVVAAVNAFYKPRKPGTSLYR